MDIEKYSFTGLLSKIDINAEKHYMNIHKMYGKRYTDGSNV